MVDFPTTKRHARHGFRAGRHGWGQRAQVQFSLSGLLCVQDETFAS